MHFIYRNTRFVRIKNGFSLSYKEQLINLDIFSSEFAISDTIISNLTITDIYAKKIITIENLTTFTYFNDPNAIIIYLGGYAGKAEIELIKKIHAFKPLKCYHIGDIDWGGFEILLNLIEKTNIKFKPLYMGIKELKKYKSECKALTPEDRIRLEKLKNKIDSSNYLSLLDVNVINYMLDNNYKLEQESLEFN